MIATYPHYPGAKVGGASADAADEIAEHAQTLKDRVDKLFDSAQLTADECAERLGQDILSVRPRLSELRRLGRIVETEDRRANRSGIKATVWRRATFQPVGQLTLI
jgi:transcription initiation factor IIE alpha subunit